MTSIGAGITFLAYSSRSGSTFLATEVANRYRVRVVPEFRSAYWLLRQEPGAPVDTEALKVVLSRDPQLTWITPREAADFLRPPRTTGEVLTWIGQRSAPDGGGTAPVSMLFKTGGVLGSWDRVRRHLPSCRVVAVVRDGRAVASSLLRTPRAYGAPGTLGRGDPVFCARQWVRDVTEQGNVAAAAPDRVRLVRYEDLVADVDGTLSQLAAWCGWAGGGTGGFEVAGAERHLHRLVGSGAVATRIDGWRHELPRRDRLVVEGLAAATLATFGYTDLLPLAGRERQVLLARARLRHARISILDGVRRLSRIRGPGELREKVAHRLRRRR